MNRSRNADSNLHFPLKLSETKESATVTCNLAPKKVWTADTAERALRAAKNELNAMQEQGKLADTHPAWMTSGEWKGMPRG